VLVLRAVKRLGPHHPFADVFATVVRKTRLWFLVALAVKLVLGYVHPPADVANTVAVLFTIAAALQVAMWARALILGMIALRSNEQDPDAASLASAMGIIKLLVTITVFTIAGIVILDNLGANVTGLVAGLGIGGIAIGLAAQGIFSDLFAALSILFDKPFQVGDTITFQGKEGPVTGVVKKIGLKSTRILSLTGELRIIGNTQLLAQEVTNFTGRQLFRFQLVVGVVYHTDPVVLTEIPRLMEAEVERAGHRFVRAAFRTFGPSSVDFDFLFEVDTGDAVAAHAAQERIAFGLLRTFKERGIEFAYPTQTTFTAAPDGTLVMPYPAPLRT
jgi:small-conductance mechanosensitive channel